MKDIILIFTFTIVFFYYKTFDLGKLPLTLLKRGSFF